MPEPTSPSSVAAAGWSPETGMAYLLAVIEANDRRYQERFESSQLALAAALSAQEKSVQAALAAADRAVSKAENASEKRFDGVNEFRQTLSDQQRTLMPRTEAEFRITALTERLAAVEKHDTERSGAKTGARDQWAYIVGAIGIVLAIASRFIP